MVHTDPVILSQRQNGQMKVIFSVGGDKMGSILTI